MFDIPFKLEFNFALPLEPFDLAKWKNYINRRTNKDGKLERINDQLNPRLERLRQEIGKAMTNQSIRRLGSELLRNEPQLKNILEKIADGKSPGLASKFMDFAGNICFSYFSQ